MFAGLLRKFSGPQDKLKRICSETGNVGKLEKLINSNPKLKTEIVRLKLDGGVTPLQLAVSRGFLEVVKYLVTTCRVNVNELSEHGFTALHVACQKDFQQIIKYLVSVGARADIEDANENTPPDVCKSPEARRLLQMAMHEKRASERPLAISSTSEENKSRGPRSDADSDSDESDVVRYPAGAESRPITSSMSVAKPVPQPQSLTLQQQSVPQHQQQPQQQQQQPNGMATAVSPGGYAPPSSPPPPLAHSTTANTTPDTSTPPIAVAVVVTEASAVLGPSATSAALPTTPSGAANTPAADGSEPPAITVTRPHSAVSPQTDAAAQPQSPTADEKSTADQSDANSSVAAPLAPLTRPPADASAEVATSPLTSSPTTMPTQAETPASTTVVTEERKLTKAELLEKKLAEKKEKKEKKLAEKAERLEKKRAEKAEKKKKKKSKEEDATGEATTSAVAGEGDASGVASPRTVDTVIAVDGTTVDRATTTEASAALAGSETEEVAQELPASVAAQESAWKEVLSEAGAAETAPDAAAASAGDATKGSRVDGAAVVASAKGSASSSPTAATNNENSETTTASTASAALPDAPETPVVNGAAAVPVAATVVASKPPPATTEIVSDKPSPSTAAPSAPSSPASTKSLVAARIAAFQAQSQTQNQSPPSWQRKGKKNEPEKVSQSQPQTSSTASVTSPDDAVKDLPGAATVAGGHSVGESGKQKPQDKGEEDSTQFDDRQIHLSMDDIYGGGEGAEEERGFDQANEAAGSEEMDGMSAGGLTTPPRASSLMNGEKMVYSDVNPASRFAPNGYNISIPASGKKNLASPAGDASSPYKAYPSHSISGTNPMLLQGQLQLGVVDANLVSAQQLLLSQVSRQPTPAQRRPSLSHGMALARSSFFNGASPFAGRHANNNGNSPGGGANDQNPKSRYKDGVYHVLVPAPLSPTW